MIKTSEICFTLTEDVLYLLSVCVELCVVVAAADGLAAAVADVAFHEILSEF